MKIAAYCRVSTDYDDQINSFESQKKYFKEYVDRQPDWELYKIYADEGLSGTSTKKRHGFNQMIQDAKRKKFDIIVTKEVSRFARNIVDAIQYTRDLKRLGIAVIFMNDAINTMMPDAEMRLGILSTFAQDESRKTSERVKWGMKRKMEQGFVFGNSFLGYNIENGVMTIDPEGAKLVKLIYHRFLNERKGSSSIAKELTAEGVPSPRGCRVWNASTVHKILRNEKYCGDLLQQKTYTPDFLTHEKKNNYGEIEQQFFSEHHEAIIDRETWQQVQEELNRRSRSEGGRAQGHSYPLSGKIICSDCNRPLVHRLRKASRGRKVSTWRCNTNDSNKRLDENGNPKKCEINYEVRTDITMEMIRECLNSIITNKEKMVTKVADIVAKVLEESNAARGNLTEDGVRSKIDKLMKDSNAVKEKKKKVLDAFFSETITKDEMQSMNREYDKQLAFIDEQIIDARQYLEQLTIMNAENGQAGDAITLLKKEVRDKLDRISNCEDAPDSFLASMVDHITCYPDRTMEVSFNFLPTRWKYTLSGYNYPRKNGTEKAGSNAESALHNNNISWNFSRPPLQLCQLSIFIHFSITNKSGNVSIAGFSFRISIDPFGS